MAFSSDEFTLFNETESSEVELHGEKAALQLYAAAFIILTFCISLPGNSFLLWVLLREQAWKTTSDILLLQLTVSNLCFTVTLPFMACNELHDWIFGKLACGVGAGIYSLGLYTSLVILTAMSLHHYVSVVQLSCQCAQVSRKFGVLMASIVIWLVCAAASIKMSVNSDVIDFGDMKVCINLTESEIMLLFDLYMEIFLFFLIPFLIITFCYVHMWIMMKKGRINSHQMPSKWILGITVGSFLCFAPTRVLYFIHSLIMMYVFEHTHALNYAWTIFYPLTHFYCCLSPLFHIIGAQRFRRYLPIRCNTLSQSRDGSNNGSSVLLYPLHNAGEM